MAAVAPGGDGGPPGGELPPWRHDGLEPDVGEEEEEEEDEQEEKHESDYRLKS